MKIFLYDKASVGKDAIPVLKARGFTLIELTNSAKDFWGTIAMLETNAVFALLSHGDESGPLMVAGNDGKDMTKAEREKFALELANKNVKFYCLSCHTGVDSDFTGALDQAKVNFVAPTGFAAFYVGQGSVNIYSKEGDKHVEWYGSEELKPSRKGKPLYFA